MANRQWEKSEQAQAWIKEMMNILEYVEKFREDTDIMDYERENLSDYLRQIKS